MLSPTTGVSGALLISCCQADCATKPALRWGCPKHNELWSKVWLQLYFLCRLSVHLVVVLSSVKDISCCGSHCASRVQSQLQGDVSTGTLCFPLLTLQSYLPLLRQAHIVVFSCTLCEFGPCLRTNQGCYLLLFERLVAVVGAGDRLEFLCCWSRRQRDLISPLQTASLTPGRGTRIPFLLTISAETEEPNVLGMNERRVEGEEQRWAVYLLTQWPMREQLYNNSTCDIIASPWRRDTSA